jgi:hypothetical protein
LATGQAVEFALSSDATCIMLRAAPSARQSSKQGFGMVKVSGPHVAADWDAAQLLKP